MRNSLQHTGRCLSSSCPLTVFTQFNLYIVLLLHSVLYSNKVEILCYFTQVAFLFYNCTCTLTTFTVTSLHFPPHTLLSGTSDQSHLLY